MSDALNVASGDPEVEQPSAPWFSQADQVGPASGWARYRDLIWAAVIIVVVIGLGAWNIITGGPIHPHV